MKSLKYKASQIIFSNHWLNLYLDQIKHSSKPDQTYTYITRRHPGVVIIPYFTAAKNLLLTYQYRHPIKKSIWQFPAGGIEPKHTPLSTARLELYEETGYQSSKMVNLGKIYPDAGIMSNNGYVLLALNPKFIGIPEKKDIYEELKTKMFTVNQVRNMIQKGVIRDGWTLSAYLLFQLYLDGQK